MNLETIARLSGVSRSTVSRVINNSPNVRAEVRERVLKVLEETNFQLNVAARGLAAGKTKILGLVVPQGLGQIFVDPYFPLLIQGVSAACNARDYSMMLWLEEPGYEQRIIRQILHSGMIDGVVITSSHFDNPVVGALAKQRFPCVVVGRVPEDLAVSYVDIDNAGSARLAVEHLLRLGRRKIAIIAGPQHMVSAADRLAGYRSALRDAGIEPLDDWIAYGEYTQESGYTAMQRLLPNRPEAVFACSDAMALGAARALQEAGIQIGSEMALVGFDDVPFASRMQPALTTMRQPIEALGRAAVELLMQQIEDPDTATPGRVLLPTELVVRESCVG